MLSVLHFVAAFATALFVGTFVEYWGHRLMHTGWFLKRHHARHHRERTGQGVAGEFRDYFVPTLLIAGAGFLVSVPAGLGFALGDAVYAFAAAYAHQVQHEKPELCFWMAAPVHRVHHDHQMWRHNFGILVDWWDRALGTYQPVPRLGEPRPWTRYPWRAWLDIQWR